MADRFGIQVAYAEPGGQAVVSLTVASGTTVREAVRLSGLAKRFADIDVEQCPLGIYGNRVPDEKAVRPGDRVEIYRPLLKDPREARRQAASAGLTLGNSVAKRQP